MAARKPKPEKRKDAVSSLGPTGSMGKRKGLFLLMAVALSLVFLLGVELVLRCCGAGYPTHFFVRLENAPAGMFTANPRFGWRFFPRRLARAPDPIRLTRIKPPGTCRIFVLGESAALGDPEPAYGFSRILQVLLEERCVGTKFEVINTGMTAINSHAILPIARDCVPFQGDIWVIYMGNNEVIGPFGAGSVLGSKSPPLWLIRASLAAKRTRLGQMLDSILQRGRFQTHDTGEWEGMKMMVNEKVRVDDPSLQRVYAHFSRNLNDILSTAVRAGVTPVVCSVSSNLKDCPPFASLSQPRLSEENQAEWTRWFASGTELEARNKYPQALEEYRKAAGIDDSYAELSFRMARCHLALGEAEAARERFARSRDLDVLRFRADTSVNQIIRDTCARRAAQGVLFFDSEAVFTKACKLGIPGEECFWDHVHLNFAGNYRLARGLADQVISLLPPKARPSAQASPGVLTEAQCAERLAFTEWDRRAVLEQMLRRVQEPPFTAQLDHDQRSERWSARLAELERKTEPAGLAAAMRSYDQALDRRGDDWVLHHRLAFLLEAAGDFPGAERHWRRVLELVPGYVDALFKLGDITARQSNLAEAEQFYRQVLRLRPNSFEAMNGLGLVLMSEGRPDDAVQLFEQALRIRPKFAEAHVNLGLLASRRGRTADAEAHYREALRCNPESAGAHIDLGNLLAAEQKHAEAIDHFRKALEIQPQEATVHLGLANSLEGVGRSSEAVAQYQEALRLKPTLAEAQFNLGVAFAKQGDLPAATTCFQAAVRLNPEDPQGHLNLGVALAQQNRLTEAIAQFEGVLRLDPANAAAKQYLRTATAR